MTISAEDRNKELAKEYNARWDAMVEKGNEAMRIVQRHMRSGIPLDPSAYPHLTVDIHAAMQRAGYSANWRAGRLADDFGDETGKPTRVRKASLETEL